MRSVGRIGWLFVGAASLAAASQAYSFALMANLRASAPSLALARNPNDAVALAKQIAANMAKSGKYVVTTIDKENAVRSLIDTPLSRSSLRIIGTGATSSGDDRAASLFMDLSNRVSRRDSLAQVWLAEQAARVRDYEAVLFHLDAAMSVVPDLRPVLNPVLVDSTKDAELRLALQPYIARNAVWVSSYLTLAAKNAALDDVMAIVEPAAAKLGKEEMEPAISHIIVRLVAEGRKSQAMDLALAVWTDFDPAAFAKIAPSVATSDQRFGPLAWSFAEANGVSARNPENGVIEVSLAPLARGSVVSRAIPVKAGARYTFSHRISFEGTPQGERLSWSVNCRSANDTSGDPVAQIGISQDQRNQVVRASVAVPAGCRLLEFTLSGSGPDGQTASNFSLSEFSLQEGS